MTNPNFNIDVTVDDGKYRFTQDVEGAILVYRHGEPWIEGSFAGINMVIAMACELEEARATLAREKETVVALESLRPVWAQGWTSDAEAAQASGNALAQLWGMLGVDNQTAAVKKLEGRAAQLKSAYIEGHRHGRADTPITYSAEENWENSQTRKSLGDRP